MVYDRGEVQPFLVRAHMGPGSSAHMIFFAYLALGTAGNTGVSDKVFFCLVMDAVTAQQKQFSGRVKTAHSNSTCPLAHQPVRQSTDNKSLSHLQPTHDASTISWDNAHLSPVAAKVQVRQGFKQGKGSCAVHAMVTGVTDVHHCPPSLLIKAQCFIYKSLVRGQMGWSGGHAHMDRWHHKTHITVTWDKTTPRRGLLHVSPRV